MDAQTSLVPPSGQEKTRGSFELRALCHSVCGEQLNDFFSDDDGPRPEALEPALAGREVEFQARLHAVLDELVTDEDQDPVTVAAVRIACRFVRVLPHSLPLPQIAIDPDGAISLDWNPSRTRAFSISVDDSGRLAFAWMNGSDRGHGVVRFQDSIPAPLLSQLTDLIDDDRAAVRAA